MINLKKAGIKSKNIPLMYANTIIGGMLFFLPILALYFEESLFSATNVAIIFAVEAFCMVLFEVPTGAIADLFGRKKTIVFSHLFDLIALIFLAVGGSMAMFICFGIFSALSRSLLSGTETAIIYDTLKEEGKEQYFKKVIGTYHALWPLGASLSSILGGYLAKVSLSLPVLATFFPVIIASILTLFLREPNYEKEDHKHIGRQMLSASKVIVHNKQLIVLILAGFVMTSLGEVVHYLSPLFLKFKEIPIEYFGYIMALTYGFSSIGHYFSHDLSEKFGNKACLIAFTFLSPLFVLMATISNGLALVAFFTFPSIFFGLKNPILSHLLNIEVASSKRATVSSISSFVGQLGIAIVAPIFGYFADIFTINTVLQLSCVAVLIAPILLLFLKEKN